MADEGHVRRHDFLHVRFQAGQDVWCYGTVIGSLAVITASRDGMVDGQRELETGFRKPYPSGRSGAPVNEHAVFLTSSPDTRVSPARWVSRSRGRY
jgi:hypothetical protein